MWRYIVFCLLIFDGHISSQPVTDESENARQARQLDFGECCPCPGPGQDFAAQESFMPAGEGMFARARDIDDCPCRARSPDSEGASSIFFPTSTRSDGNFVKPGPGTDKKEDFKPLLHPEVDLASSVLQTLREATDEEYQDALARDAARSMAKAAEETIFGDAVPEASNGNIVTIIVNPKQTESLDDVIPQETHVQESRCIHAPLESVSPSLGEMRAQKPPSLLREIFGLPRVSKSTGLMHKNLLDMDNGASNIQERVEPVERDQSTTKSALGLRKYAPLMKVDTNIGDKSRNMRNNVVVDTSVKKVPDFKLPAMKNKLKDLLSNIPAFERKDRKDSLPSIPKIKLNNPLLNVKGKNEEDLSLSPSNIHEQAKKSFFQTKSHLENILQNTRPVGLKTLLKLKDVEFVPLKDLVPKAAERPPLNKPKFVWPDIFKKGDSVISNTKDQQPKNVDKTTEILEKVPISKKDESFDAEVSPSNLIEQFTDDNCKNEAFQTTDTDGDDTEAKTAETIDTALSPSETQEIVSETTQNVANSQSNELPDITDDCNVETLPDTEINQPKSMESSFEDETQSNNEEIYFETSKETTPENSKEEDDPKFEFVTNDEDCVSNNNNADSVTDSSDNTYDVLEPHDKSLEKVDDSFVNKTTETQEPCSQELQVSDNPKTLDNNATKVIVPLSLHETLSTIKDNIRKHIENLKNPKINSKTSENLDSPTTSNIIENKVPLITYEKLNADCLNEESIQITTVKPNICDDDLEIEREADDKVSMHDLQKISDEMLQEEQERESKTLNCIEPNQEETDPNISIEENNTRNESIDSEQSANTQNEVVMDPQNIINIEGKNDNMINNSCHSDLRSPKQIFEQESDSNVAASEVVFNRTPQNNEIFESPLLLSKVLQPNKNDFSLSIPLPDIPGIKLEPLPTLDEIELSLNNLFKPARDVEEHSVSEATSMADTSNILAPIMSTDASAKHFQSMLPSLRLEDVNLDILQLKPQSNLLSVFPKVDLHSLNLPLMPTDLRIKPIKLQSVFEDKGGLLGASLSHGKNNPWESIPTWNDFGTRLKADTQKMAKTLRKPDTLRHKIGDLSDTKHSLKSMQHTLESKIRGATIKPVNLQSNDLLEAISRNHEDVNDKLRALHVDFNDRLETMRSNLFDKSIFGSEESRSTKSFSTFSNKHKDKKISLKTKEPQSLSNRREFKKTSKPRRLIEKQRETKTGLKKFKMPTAASVPVPRTIEVPELKATLTKSPRLGIQRASGVNPIFQSIDASPIKESSIALWKQASKKLPVTNTRLGKTINPFKDSKIKVSFSTTPRPTLSSRLQSRTLSTPSSLSPTSDLGKNTRRFGQRFDHSGSPSELKNSIASPPISNHLDQENFQNHGFQSVSRKTGVLPTRKLSGGDNLEQPKMSTDLQSWPKVTESAFLSKVKEAVRARMAKVNSPVMKQTDIQSVSDVGESRKLDTDMARSASTNIDVVEGHALKENVSYKCTMVCTKE